MANKKPPRPQDAALDDEALLDALALLPAEAARDPKRDRIAGQRLNLTRLRYFVAVAEDLHFGRAAQRLGISQPPLSLHIKALEEEIGVDLFTRVNRKVFLTASGRILHQQAARLLDHVQRVDHIMQGVGAGEYGELFVGCVPSAMYDILPKIMRHFRGLHPKVHLVLKEGHTMDITDEVVEGRLDIGLVWRNVSDPSLGIQPILREQFSAIVPADHRLAKKKTLSLRDLASESLILPPRKVSPYHYDHIIAAFAKQGLNPRIEYEVPTILSQIGFVASGFGVAISPSVARRFATDGVAVIPFAEEMPPVILSLVWNKERDSNAGEQFREAVKGLYRSDS
ncbi:DNA-binding transcriptional LysR family regulator [Rhizobium sp. BK313]|jgi:DNA-binding transcriptional LysR family regulator|uniref:LysR family transcriptional regulator n=1 Tax=Rhizobium sp. BK313 TaxID=2587081 RepID=UPI0014151C57|nr:LysR family transcriptional regulator [Rhizobium sp. BK313]MBB3459405.1 DNA-binding transcriptional LysR family regulator [Rhizobium sp. BK313]